MAEIQQPIIIKRITINEAAHHGGSWKVAYADFVTAMMAFFLLLWLLSSASDASLEGIADYFTPTIGIKDMMGTGFEGGTTVDVEDGKKRKDMSRPNIISGQPPQGVKPEDLKKKALIEAPDGEDMLFEKAAAAVVQAVANDKTLSDLGENFRMEQTPEGLKIQVMDTEKDPMFQSGSVDLTDAGKRLIARIGEVINGTPNHISIVGHTDSVNPTNTNGTSNWELSTERANAARRYLRSQGMIEERVAKVQGRADKELLFIADSKNPKNRRIEFILLRGDHMTIPEEDNPAGALYNIEDRRSDTLKFEDKVKQRVQESQNPKEQSFTPSTIIPDKPIRENISPLQDTLEFNAE